MEWRRGRTWWLAGALLANALACSKSPGATAGAGDAAAGGAGGSTVGDAGGVGGGASDAARPDAVTAADATAATDAPAADGGDASGGGPYPEAPGLCRSGWCWSNPLPQGNYLTSMCGRSASDVWAVGYGATVLHWDGTQWSMVPTPIVAGTGGDLKDVWCSPGGSVWVVGNYAIARIQNGVATDMTPASPDSYESVAGTAEDDVWIGGFEDSALHWNGSQLVELHRATSNPPTGGSMLWDIVALARNDVWFGGEYSTYHYDGSTFTEVPLSGQKRFWWASGDDLLAAVFDVGLYRWSDQAPASWQLVAAPFDRPSAGDGYMFGPSSHDLWWGERSGGLSHWDGTAWYYPQQPSRVWTNGYVAPTGEVFVGGAQGHLGRFAATPARVQDRTIETLGRGWDLQDFLGIWSSPEGDVYAVPGPYQLTADGWTPVTISGGVQFFEAIWGSSAHDVWAVGEDGRLAHFDGQTWTLDDSAPAQDAYSLFAVGGTGPNDVWAVGRSGMVGHYDGSSWQFGLKASLQDLRGVWAASPDEVWAVGMSGAIQHYTTAGGWKLLSQVTSLNLHGVWGAAANDVWAAGDLGYVLHWNGTAWSPTMISGMGPPQLNAVVGRASNDVWVAGQFGTLLHWNGSKWSDGSSPTSMDLNALWVGAAGDVWLAGAGSTILRRR
jgi:hypothetical protein